MFYKKYSKVTEKSYKFYLHVLQETLASIYMYSQFTIMTVIIWPKCQAEYNNNYKICFIKNLCVN